MSKRKRIVHAKTPHGQLAGEAVVEAIENQIRDNDPPETALTLARLMKSGESRENAIRLIGCAMAIEIFEIVKNGGDFDEERYVQNLLRLPELPFEGSDEI
jgi:hypothetical protein